MKNFIIVVVVVISSIILMSCGVAEESPKGKFFITMKSDKSPKITCGYYYYEACGFTLYGCSDGKPMTCKTYKEVQEYTTQ